MKKTLLTTAVLTAFASVSYAAPITSGFSTAVDYESSDEVNISSNLAEGAGAVFVTGGVTNLTGSSIVFEDAGKGAAIYAKSLGSSANSTINVGTQGSVISITGGMHGIRANNGSGGTPLAKVTVNGSSLTITGADNGVMVQGQIAPKPETEAQIEAMTKDQRASVTVLADTTTITGVKRGVFVTGAGQVDIEGETLIIEAEDAIVARGESVVNINSNVAKIKGNVDFSYDKDGGGNYPVDSTINVNLSGSESYWQGAVKASWDSQTDIPATDMKVDTFNLTLKEGAKWIPTEQEKNDVSGTGGETRLAVNNLKLDGGIVEVGAGIEADVEVLSGEGTVHMDSANPGKFTAENGSTATLSVTMTGNADTVTEEKAAAVMANVTGVANATGTVEEGMYNGAMTLNADGEVTAVATNSVMSNTLDLASSAPLAMNRLLMNDVRKRMGDLRAAEGTHGVWARYDGGKLSGERGLENDFTTVQVGIDTVPVVDAPRFGVAFAYTKSDADMLRGSADMDAFSLAFYGTKFYDNGMFVDVIGRMATADTDVTVEGQKGTMDNVALSLSGELGWRFEVTEKFYFEPQAELTYTYVNADKLALGDSSYAFDSVDSLMGRVGFAAGFKCPSNFGDVYVRASAVHEFLGDSAVAGGNGTIHEVDGEDTWVEFGVGAQFNVNKNTYVYADIERTEGAKLEEDWRANVGVRFAF